MKVYEFITTLVGEYPRLFVINILLIVIMTIVDATAIISLAPAVDILISSSSEKTSSISLYINSILEQIGITPSLGIILFIILLLHFLRSAFSILSSYYIFKIKYAVTGDILIGTFKDFFKARWSFFSMSSQGKLLNTFTREITNVGDSFGAMAKLFASLIQMSLYIILPFFISWKLTIISLITASVFSIPFFMLGRISLALGKENTSTSNKFISVLQESLTAAKIILGFGNQRVSIKNLTSAFNAHLRITIKAQLLKLAIPKVYQPFGMIVVFTVLLISQKFSTPLAETVILLYSLNKVVPMFGSLANQKNVLDSFFPSYDQVIRLRHRAKELFQPTGNKPFVSIQRGIEIRNLSYSYSGRSNTLLNITISVPKGKMTALVGESGAGKSTLVNMIMGFDKASSGEIRIDDIPLLEYNIESYRKRIGYVPQESILFNMSIKDNLLWANENATYEDIKKACRDANAHKFIETFPDGYETIVGDRGVRLSGGQAQRVSLARAILRKPDLLILDEATSSVDSHSERMIQKAIENISKTTTTVAIAHRLSTIKKSDRIYVLNNGRLIEEGTYSQLRALDGHFSFMAEAQVLGEKEQEFE